jgi:signal transduction histidine kinase
VETLWLGKIEEYRTQGVPIEPIKVRITRKDGSECRVIANTELSSRRTMVIFTDITERERHQEEQIRQQKLESIGVLAGGIAHDFNNVLTAIIGNLSFAELFIEEGHRAHRPMAQAQKAAKRAAELAHQLLTFAKGGQPVTCSVNPLHLLEESLSLVLHGTNVKGGIEADAGLYNIEADAGQISQVFNNLLINAVQSMPGGGTISISASNALVAPDKAQGLKPGRYVRFLFRDQGCGMSEELMKKIFDPYFTTKPYGSGLGLASVQSIVNRHGGHVSVSSRPGMGSTFELLLPASGVETGDRAEAAKNTALMPDDAADASILVMDDEEMIRDMASAMLEIGRAHV